MIAPPNEAPIGSAAWLDAELRARFGDGAKAGEITFEGRTVRVTGARVPLGSLLLSIAFAQIELGAGAPVGALPLSARLVSLAGTLSQAGTALSIPISLTAVEPPAARWFSGAVRSHGARAAGIGFELDATLDLGADGARLAGRVRIEDAAVFGEPEDAVAVSAEPAIEIDLATHGALEDAAVRGRVFARRITVGRRSSPVTLGPQAAPDPGALQAPDIACRFDDVSALVDVDRRRLRYRDLEARSRGARVTGWGRVPFEEPASGAAAVPLAALAIERAGVGLCASLAALAGVTVRASRAPLEAPDVIAIPADLSASGEVVVSRDRALSAAFTLSTPRSELRLRLAPSAVLAFEGSTLRGRLGVEDAIVLGMFPGPVRPRPDTILDVDARLTGSIARPGLTGRIGAARAIVDVSSDPAHPSFLLEDISTLLDVGRDHVAWHRLAGRFYGGTFTSSGRVGLGHTWGLDATLSFSGVRVERLPTQAQGESQLATILAGAAAGELRFERHAAEGAAPAMRGQVSIVSPHYLFVRRFAPDLERLGLPAVRSRGVRPFTANVRLRRDRILVEELAGAIEGIEATGDASVGLDGRLQGAIVLNLLESYLRQSPILAVSAAIGGRIAVPVEIGGTVSAPEIRTKALAVLESLLMENRVGDAVKSVLDNLGQWGSPRRRKDP